MKIALVMGRGIEGCGVTKYTLEQLSYLEKHGYQVQAFASADKTWSRKNSHDHSNIIKIKLSNPEYVKILVDECNLSDVVIINSLPAVTAGDEAIDGFKTFLQNVKTPIVLIQHDHSSISIKRNACLEEAIQSAKVIFAHSTNNDFSDMARNILGIGGITSFFSDDETPILSFQPGMDFDACRAKYWKPIEETNPVINRWIGRTTTWKGYKQMFPFHNNYLRHGHFITIFEGIDAAPAFLDFRVLSDFHNHVKPYKRIEEFSEDYFKPDQPAYVFSSYKQEEMLQRMSRSGFGYQLSHMKEKYIYKSIEYTHAEVVCSGAIPVFASSYGEMCKHRTQNIPLIECENNGTIWLDKDNMGSAYSLIDKLSKDDVMRDEWRNMAFEFYKEHQDSEYAFTQLMNDIRDNI